MPKWVWPFMNRYRMTNINTLNYSQTLIISHHPFHHKVWYKQGVTYLIIFQNVTLSNMSHLVYIILYGKTDGVILSRLDCTLNMSCSLDTCAMFIKVVFVTYHVASNAHVKTLSSSHPMITTNVMNPWWIVNHIFRVTLHIDQEPWPWNLSKSRIMGNRNPILQLVGPKLSVSGDQPMLGGNPPC
jgi:hypothetical protein